MGLCDHICGTGTEEQCNACLIQQAADLYDKLQAEADFALKVHQISDSDYKAVSASIKRSSDLFYAALDKH